MIGSIKQASQRAIHLYLAWLVFISLVSVISLAELSPIKFKILETNYIFLLMIQAELFFVLVVLPWFLPSLMDGFKESWINIVTTIFVLFLFSLPIMLICQNLSSVDGDSFVKAFATVFACTLFVCSLFVTAHLFKIHITPFYFLVLFLVQSMGTFLWYLSLEYDLKLDFLSALSPFRGVLELSSSLVTSQILFFVILSALLFVSTIPAALKQSRTPKL